MRVPFESVGICELSVSVEVAVDTQNPEGIFQSMMRGSRRRGRKGACCMAESSTQQLACVAGVAPGRFGWEGRTIGDRPALYPRPRPFVRWLTQIYKWLKRYFVKSELSTFVSKVYWETTY
jgi:hypothetical protein